MMAISSDTCRHEHVMDDWGAPSITEQGDRVIADPIEWRCYYVVIGSGQSSRLTEPLNQTRHCLPLATRKLPSCFCDGT